MNNSITYSNKDEVTSATWSIDPLWPMGDSCDPNLSVPQSTHPEFVSSSGDPSTVGAFGNLPTRVDYYTTECPRLLVDVSSMYVPFLHLPRSLVFTRRESKVPEVRLDRKTSPELHRISRDQRIRISKQSVCPSRRWRKGKRRGNQTGC